ncbi:pyridoxamine 5'-phosphate oxidase family protein [Rufibacter glacialis]|uniref:Pyridoxamine 5'-phosphate oxidase family protein n=1 Tax=Rufibacter glacialis TaxID=1259555 RepID=A0ABV4RMG2_9BACT
MNPFIIFQNWLQEELNLTQVRIPTACCLSTVGLDGFPNARFVSLKEVIDDSFVVTGPINSRKGLEINQINKVALTFWWVESERQVRIQGRASKNSRKGNSYFTTTCRQIFFRKKQRQPNSLHCLQPRTRAFKHKQTS